MSEGKYYTYRKALIVIRTFHLNEHAITGGVHCMRVYSFQPYELQQSANHQDFVRPPHRVYTCVLHMHPAHKQIWHPLTGEMIVFQIHCLLLWQLTVISPACCVTPVMLLILLLTSLLARCTQAGYDNVHFAVLSDRDIFANVAFMGQQQCLSWWAAVFIKMLQLLCRWKTGEKLGYVLYIGLQYFTLQQNSKLGVRRVHYTRGQWSFFASLVSVHFHVVWRLIMSCCL